MKRLLFTFSVAIVAAFAQNPPANGVIRLGLVQPKLQMGSGAAPEALGTLLSRYLSGPQIEVVPIAAMLPLQADVEARQKSCGYLLYASLSQKQSRRMGLLGGVQAMSHMVPVVGMAGRAASIVGQAAAITAVNAAAQLSSGVTARSEIVLQYQLTAPSGGAPILSDTRKAKAESNGQDVITPLIEEAAAAVANAILSK